MRIVEILFYDTNKVKLVVEMPDPNRYTTDHVPHLPRSLFKLFPHLAHHKCHNDHGHSFRRESLATEIPHLLEHLIIELQTQAQRHEILKGETQWNWRVDPRGTFHVQCGECGTAGRTRTASFSTVTGTHSFHRAWQASCLA